MTTDCGPVRLLQSRVNKVMFLLKSMLTCDEPLLSGQSPLSGNFPVPAGGRLMVVQQCNDVQTDATDFINLKLVQTRKNVRCLKWQRRKISSAYVKVLL